MNPCRICSGSGVITSNRSGTGPIGAVPGMVDSSAAPGAYRLLPDVAAAAAHAPMSTRARPAQIPAMVKLPPRLSARRGDAEIFREWRSGFSTSRKVTQAGTTEASAIASPCVTDRSPQCAAATMSIGQCHRYSEYDRSPTQRKGRVPSTTTGPREPAATPAAITAAAPSVGSAAAYPGQAVFALTSSAAATTATRPAHARTTAGNRGRRAAAGASRATPAPTASSQSRVVETKNARSGAVAVSTIDQANDGTARTARPTHSTGRTFVRRRPRAARIARTISSGQSR